jgi:hypothetical protein
MYSILVATHNYLHYLLLILLIALIGRSFYCWRKKIAYNQTTDKIGLYTFITTHTQLLLGLILYAISPFVHLANFSVAIKDKVSRFWTVEHITLMLIAVALITVARITMKKIPLDENKHKRLFILNTVALILILGAIPYPSMPAIGAGRFYLFGFF